MIINHNIVAMNAYKNLTGVNDNITKSLEKLSSGLRINRAGDDAAGLAISEKMRGQIRGMNMATKNSQDAISLIQTGEGALNEVHAILQRMRELSVQAANDTNTDQDRAQIQKEMNQLRTEIDRIATTTQFNTKTLFTGSYVSTGLSFHIGANSNQTVSLKINQLTATILGIQGGTVSTSISISSAPNAETAIDAVNSALDQVSDLRSRFGAMQNRLEHTINNLRTSAENLQAAESRIRDVDMANEMVRFSKDRIISQSGTAMLAQANANPQGILQLLQG